MTAQFTLHRAGIGMTTLALSFGTAVAAQEYSCDRILPQTRTTVPFVDVQFEAEELRISDWQPPITAHLIDGGANGQVYLHPQYLYLVFGPAPGDSLAEVFGPGPVSVTILFRDPIAPAVTEATCQRVRP
jgi:hypothetical protein